MASYSILTPEAFKTAPRRATRLCGRSARSELVMPGLVPGIHVFAELK
jgi:hypothetical protein